MAEENSDQKNMVVRVPIAGIAVAALVGMALAAYFMAGRQDESPSVTEKAKSSGKSVRKRLGLMTLITLIENDATRKVVVALLRAMARRA